MKSETFYFILLLCLIIGLVLIFGAYAFAQTIDEETSSIIDLSTSTIEESFDYPNYFPENFNSPLLLGGGSCDYEDFTTYTEVDSGGTITIADDQIISLNTLADSDNYVYKDFGLNYFNAFDDITWEAQINNNAGKSGGWAGVGFSNNVDDDGGWTEGISCKLSDYHLSPAQVRAELRTEYGGGRQDVELLGTSFGVYYFKLVREEDGDTIHCYVYDDSARTNEVAALELSGFGTLKFRYAYAFSVENVSSVNYSFTGYFKDLCLNYSSSTPSTTDYINEFNYSLLVFFGIIILVITMSLFIGKGSILN